MKKSVINADFKPGSELVLINDNPNTTRYRVDFGDSGGVLVTLLPGGELTVVMGRVVPTINIYDGPPTGIRPV